MAESNQRASLTSLKKAQEVALKRGHGKNKSDLYLMYLRRAKFQALNEEKAKARDEKAKAHGTQDGRFRTVDRV